MFEGLKLKAKNNHSIRKSYIGTEAMVETSLAPTLRFGKGTDISGELNKIPRSDFLQSIIRQNEMPRNN